MARALLLLLTLSSPAFAGDYSFTFEGKPHAPTVVSLAGTPGSPAEGDLICLSGHWMVLGPPGDYRFEEKGKRLFRTVEGGEPWIVSLDDHLLLAGMDPAAIRRLRGVWFRSGKHQKLEALRHLDGPRVCVSMGTSGRPPLPKDLRYLRLAYWSMRNSDSRRWLNGFPCLRVLSVSAWSNLPPSKLPRAPELRVLSAPRMEAGDHGTLRSYPKLRSLDLTMAENLTSLDFVTFFPHLARLNVSRTRVASLAPLKDHLAIRHIDASESLVTVLPPGKLPRLRRLDIHRADKDYRHKDRGRGRIPPIGDGVVAEFRLRNPGCDVRWRWGIAPAEAFAGVDRLVLRNGRSFRPRSEVGKLRFECVKPDEIRTLLAGLHLRDEYSGGSCYCSGDHLMEMYRGDELVAKVSIQHGVALRWLEGEWDGDAWLAPAARRHLEDWLERRGVDELKTDPHVITR